MTVAESSTMRQDLAPTCLVSGAMLVTGPISGAPAYTQAGWWSDTAIERRQPYLLPDGVCRHDDGIERGHCACRWRDFSIRSYSTVSYVKFSQETLAKGFSVAGWGFCR